MCVNGRDAAFDGCAAEIGRARRVSRREDNMKLIATAAAVLALVGAPALAQTTASPSASPAPPAPAQAANVAPAPAAIGPGMAGVTPALIAGGAVFVGLGIFALSNGGGNGAASTTSTPSTR
jgi:hypothetical protein